jgi:putative tryptophan/tyrosine transport system substrate-binding protein
MRTQRPSRNPKAIANLAIALVITLLSWPHLAEAQLSKKVPRIGFLSTGSDSNITAFQQGLRDLGYIEGQTIFIEYRKGNYDQLPGLAAELLRLNLDLLFAPSTPAASAAKNATQTIPIVFASVSDPLANGLVSSLARPGDNLTGPSQMSADLSGKRLELLKEVVPRLSHVAILRDYSPQSEVALKETQSAAEALGVQLRIFDVRDPNDFDSAFSEMSKGRLSGLVVISSPIILGGRNRLTALATKRRLPAVYTLKEYVEAGGLMSYGVSLPHLFRRAAIYVDKILKGAKPADLPVEQPMKFEPIFNLKTAKQIGLTIPPNVLARADRVIR